MWFFYLVWMHLLSQDDVMCYPFHGTHSFCHFSMLFSSFIHSFILQATEPGWFNATSEWVSWSLLKRSQQLYASNSFLTSGRTDGDKMQAHNWCSSVFFSAHFMLILSIYHPYNRTVNLFTEVSPLNLRLLYLKIARWQDLCLHGIRAVLLSPLPTLATIIPFSSSGFSSVILKLYSFRFKAGSRIHKHPSHWLTAHLSDARHSVRYRT